jgi:hypothetical protein
LPSVISPYLLIGFFEGNAFMLLAVVIPVLNEAETMPLILARLRDTLREETWEAIFEDDGSAGGRSRTEEISFYRPQAGVRG